MTDRSEPLNNYGKVGTSKYTAFYKEPIWRELEEISDKTDIMGTENREVFCDRERKLRGGGTGLPN